MACKAKSPKAVAALLQARVDLRPDANVTDLAHKFDMCPCMLCFWLQSHNMLCQMLNTHAACLLATMLSTKIAQASRRQHFFMVLRRHTRLGQICVMPLVHTCVQKASFSCSSFCSLVPNGIYKACVVQGYTPLMWACHYDHSETATLLLSDARSKAQLNNRVINGRGDYHSAPGHTVCHT